MGVEWTRPRLVPGAQDADGAWVCSSSLPYPYTPYRKVRIVSRRPGGEEETR